MRTHRQLVVHQTILQVLQEPGCPFCRFLKEFQTARLQNHPKENIHRLCNFHAWGLAAVQDALAAAQVFIELVDQRVEPSNTDAGCDICAEVLAEEELRLREFAGCLGRNDVTRWLRESAALCIPHGLRLRQQVPPVLGARIDTIIEKYRQQLAEELKHLSAEPEGDRAGWGALGRAAEFLVSQRGLHS